MAYPDQARGVFAAVEDGSFWFEHRNQVLASLLQCFPPPGRLFDVGGGNGYQARFFEGLGLSTALVEPGAEGCVIARRRGVDWVIQGHWQDLGFGPETVGAVGLFDVLEHLEDPGTLVQAAVDALIPGGRLYATVPAHPWLWSDEDEIAQHQRRYRRGEFEQLLASRGLELEWSSACFGALVGPIWVGRSLPSRWRRARGGALPAEADAARTRQDHHATGWARRWVDRRLAGERKQIAAGRAPRWGSSWVAVARRPPRG
ncbi:MAG: class I SAM-dependent methyltransferase [Myxococcota bacterium]